MPIVVRVLESKAAAAADRAAETKRPLYYYVNHGDFSIVWPNVVVFAIAHLLFFRFLYEAISFYETKHAYTFIFSKMPLA